MLNQLILECSHLLAQKLHSPTIKRSVFNIRVTQFFSHP
jgi:hypothetical protein